MKTLNLPSSPNNSEVANFIKSTRTSLRKEVSGIYGIRTISNFIGCSPTHYIRLERGEREFSRIDLIYGLVYFLDIPIDTIISKYLGLSDEEIKKNFSITEKYHNRTDNSKLLHEARTQKNCFGKSKYTIRELAQIIGISTTHYNRIEQGINTFKDIRLIYSASKALDIPMYVIIRNELNLNDAIMKTIISLYL